MARKYLVPLRLYSSASNPTGAAGDIMYNTSTGFVVHNGTAWIASLTNPMTTQGDMIYGGASGAATGRVGIGTAGQALVVNSGATAPVWTTLTLENLPGAFVKKSVRCATDAALGGTYSNGTAGVGATLTLASIPGIDGVTTVNGDRILVKNQATTSQNGIYVRTSSTVLTRASDADTPADISSALVGVDEGGLFGGKLFTSPFLATGTIGTTAITYYKVIDELDGPGNVNGPASSTDTAVARFSGVGGKSIQNSGVTIDASNNITTAGNIAVNNGTSTAITTTGTTAAVFNTNATTVNAFGAAQTINIGASTGTTNINNMLNLAASTATMAAAKFTSGSLKTSGFAQGDTEFDGRLFVTPNTTVGRGLIPVRQINRRTANNSATLSATLLSIFDENTNATDTITLLAATLYRFKLSVFWTFTHAGTNLNSQLGFTFSQTPQQFDMGINTGIITNGVGSAYGRTAFSATSGTAYNVMPQQTASGTMWTQVEGWILTNATTGGTLTPQWATTSTAAGSFQIMRNTNIEIEQIGTSSTSVIGTWA